MIDAFHQLHGKRYGHCCEDEPVELVTIRVRAVGRLDKPMMSPLDKKQGCCKEAYVGRKNQMKLYQRSRLAAGDTLLGPLLLIEDYATTYVPKNWECRVDRWGHVWLEREREI